MTSLPTADFQPHAIPGATQNTGPMQHNAPARRAMAQLSQTPLHVINGVAYSANDFDIDRVISFLVNARISTVVATPYEMAN